MNGERLQVFTLSHFLPREPGTTSLENTLKPNRAAAIPFSRPADIAEEVAGVFGRRIDTAMFRYEPDETASVVGPSPRTQGR